MKALAWHPWKNSLLACGCTDEASARVTIWNINTQNQVAREKTSHKNSSIGALTFNPISGELVVSNFPLLNKSQIRLSGQLFCT